MEGVIIVIAIFGTLFGIVYLFYSTRNKERMALIEKGADASLFSIPKGSGNPYQWGKLTLKIGMLAIGIGIGIIVGAILAEAGVLNEGAMYTSMMLLFGGLSLVVFYLIDRKAK